MFFNYIKLSLRSLLRDSTYSAINIGGLAFALAGALALGVAFLTMSIQTIKAAFTNPAHSLRNE